MTQPNGNSQRAHESAAPFELSQDAWGRLTLTGADGVSHVGVQPVRAFPIGDPGRWIALVDAEGRELALVEDPAQLPEKLRQRLVCELERAEFVPRIVRIVTASAQNDPAVWQVETDRGRVEITIQNETDVRRIGAHEALVVDRHGIRFLIPDRRQLDRYSRRVLERFI